METLVYSGLIKEEGYGDGFSYFIGDTERPISYELQEEISGKNVSVRYWISDIPQTREQLKEEFLSSLSGGILSEYSPKYSDITGYLWTDEEITVGGHDLLQEITDNIGKYIYLEIDIHE